MTCLQKQVASIATLPCPDIRPFGQACWKLLEFELQMQQPQHEWQQGEACIQLELSLP